MWRSEDGKLDLEEFSALLDTLSSSSEDDRSVAIRIRTWNWNWICINLFPQRPAAVFSPGPRWEWVHWLPRHPGVPLLHQGQSQPRGSQAQVIQVLWQVSLDMDIRDELFNFFLILRLGNKVITKMEMLRTLVLLGQIEVGWFYNLHFLKQIKLRLTWQCWRRRRRWSFQMRLRTCSGVFVILFFIP